MTLDTSPRDLLAQLAAGRLSRRAFITRLVALGCSASTIAALLAACSPNPLAKSPPPPGQGNAPTVAPNVTPPADPSTSRRAGTRTPGRETARATPLPVRLGAASNGPFGAAGGLGPGPTTRGAGGVLTVRYWQAPTILNPHLAQGPKDRDAARLVYEPLAEFGPDDTLVPWLAAEIPTARNGGVAADGASVVWKLKQGVKWSDGAPFTARDCVFTWYYVTDDATNATTRGNYAGVKQVEALDDYTVKVTFREPTIAWYRPLTDAILPAHIFGQGMGGNGRYFPANLQPVGTGPYLVDTFTPGASIRLRLNPAWRDPHGPCFSQVIWQGGGDALAAASALFERQECQVAWNLQLAPETLETLARQSAGSAQLGFQLGHGVEQVLLNFRDPTSTSGALARRPHPFLTDQRVRQALCLLADRQTIAETLYGPAGEPSATLLNAPPAFLPPVDWAFDLDQAARLLDTAGWTRKGAYRVKNGVQLRVRYQAVVNTVQQRVQQILKDALEQAGIQTDLQRVDPDSFFSGDASDPGSAVRFAADLEMFTQSAETPDLRGYLDCWTTAAIPTEANQWQGGNYASYSNPDYDRLNARARRELDPDAYRTLCQQQLALLHDDAVAIPLVGRKLVFGYATGLAGFYAGPWTGLTWNIANWTKQ